jgi:hypothetical protein
MGAIYAEAAVILPVLLLVVFVSIFFFLLAVRQFSLQMLASEIAKDISLALDPRADRATATRRGCIQKTCAYTNPDFLTKFDTRLSLPTLLNQRYTTTTGCWNLCAQQEYFLATAAVGGVPGLQISLTAYPTLQWFDPTPTGTPTISNAAVGDYITVQLTYPARAIWRRGIPMFGAVANINLVGTAITVLERPGSAALED